MNIVLLGEPSLRLDFLRSPHDRVFHATEPNSLDKIFEEHRVHFLVSYGYRFLVPNRLLGLVDGLAVNLHIGHLPFNRGAHPNLWANLENTPSGVTIHKMSPEIDKGSILLQEKVILDEDLTFKQTYENLSKSIECLFEKHNQELIHNQLPSFKQLGKGSYHRLVDLQPVSSIMKYGWETVIKNAKRDYLYLLQSQGHKDLCCIHHGN